MKRWKIIALLKKNHTIFHLPSIVWKCLRIIFVESQLMNWASLYAFLMYDVHEINFIAQVTIKEIKPINWIASKQTHILSLKWMNCCHLLPSSLSAVIYYLIGHWRRLLWEFYLSCGFPDLYQKFSTCLWIFLKNFYCSLARSSVQCWNVLH